MKTNLFILLLAPIVAITLFSGCTQTISLGIDDYDPKVVVISKCEVDSVPQIFLTLSESAFGYISTSQNQSTNLVSWLKGATVTLTEEGTGQSQTLTEGRYKLDTTYQYINLEEPPYYRMDTLIREVIGYRGNTPLKAQTRYTLTITHLGQKYTSSAVAIEKPGSFLNEVKDEALTYPGSGGWYYKQVSISIKGDQQERPYEITTSLNQPYYRYTYILDTLPDGTITQDIRTDTFYNKIVTSNNLRLKGDANQTISLPVHTYSPWQGQHDTVTMHIKVSLISEETWGYQNALYGQYGSNFNNPFSEPVILPTNIRGGLGHFYLTHTRDTTIQITLNP